MKTLAEKRRTTDAGAFLTDARGAAALELAMVAPFLLIGAVALADLGLPIYQKMQTQSAVQAGAQFAATHGFDSNAISAVAMNSTRLTNISLTPAPSQFCGCSSSTGLTPVLCDTICASGDTAGSYVQVNASAQAPRLLPFGGSSNAVTVTAQATIRIK